jgi:hypothetical protein
MVCVPLIKLLSGIGLTAIFTACEVSTQPPDKVMRLNHDVVVRAEGERFWLLPLIAAKALSADSVETIQWYV